MPALRPAFESEELPGTQPGEYVGVDDPLLALVEATAIRGLEALGYEGIDGVVRLEVEMKSAEAGTSWRPTSASAVLVRSPR